VPVEALSGLLLDAGTVSSIIGSSLAVNPSLTTTRLYTDTTNQPECGGVWANANQEVYSGSGWVSAQSQYLREPINDYQHIVFESAIGFSTAEGAANFVAKEAKNWAKCAGRSITTTTANATPHNWWVTSVSQPDGMLTALSTQEGARGWRC
jgi:serine/threonine kinase PknH